MEDHIVPQSHFQTSLAGQGHAHNHRSFVPTSLRFNSKHIGPSGNNSSMATNSPPPSVDDFAHISNTSDLLASIGSGDYNKAREHILNSIRTSDQLPVLPPLYPSSSRRPQGPARQAIHQSPNFAQSAADSAQLTSAVATSESAAAMNPIPSSQPELSTIQPALPHAVTIKKEPKKRPIAAKARGKKRKHKISESATVINLSDDDSEVYEATPRITKSGRAVNRPPQFTPAVASAVKRGPGKKQKRNPDLAVCTSCERGHSPNTNAIVFCDGCGTPYHQYCHNPPIDKDYIIDLDKEWLCKKCLTRTTESRPLRPTLRPGFSLTEQEVCH